jgi:hypothetical protein
MKQTILERMQENKQRREQARAGSVSESRTDEECEVSEYQAAEQRSVLRALQEEHFELGADVQVINDWYDRMSEALLYLVALEEGEVLDEDGRWVSIKQFLHVKRAAGSKERTEHALGVEVAVASTSATVASTSATAMHIDLEAEAGPTATQEEAEPSEAATPRKRARAEGAEVLERMADEMYSWRVLKEQDVPNALEEVAMKLSTMPAVLEVIQHNRDVRAGGGALRAVKALCARLEGGVCARARGR